MPFEFDEQKSAANSVKHGIDFGQAQSLWSEPHLLEVPARTDDEVRFLAIGRIGNKHWAAIFTRRGVNIRVISVRRARREEIERYQGD